MADEATDPPVPTVIAAPPGLTAIDGTGKVLPIVALQVEHEGRSTTVIPLYLGDSGQAVPIFPGAKIGLSSAWNPTNLESPSIYS
jgi:hypothetical protein